MPWLRAGAIAALVAVAAGAFGAHALRDAVPTDRLAIFETAARYQMYHSLGIIAVGLILQHRRSTLLDWSARLFLAGIFIFSGSLYLLALTGTGWLGAVTPLGGAAFLAGWACLALGASWER